MMLSATGAPENVVVVDEIIGPGGTEPLAPGVLAGFDAINFDSDNALNGVYQIPPDPIGAAGSNHLVNVVNSSIQWFTKSGTLQNSQRLGKNGSTHVGSFFEPLTPVNQTFDPKVIYDQHAGRFVVVTLEKVDLGAGNPGNTSRILIAVSDDDDPNGTWYFMAINSKLTISSTATWADYPGFAVDEEAVYVAANMFGFGAGGANLGSRLWIINKSPLFSGGAGTFTVHDPFASVGSWSTAQPAHVFGAGGVPSGAGTFLVSAGWVSGAVDYLSVIRVDSPLSSPSFVNQFVSLGDIHNGSVPFPNAPQPGTSELVWANDTRALHAVWRNNNLYVVNTVVPPSGTDSGQATAHWYRINTTTLGSLSLADQGNIGGEELASGTHTYFPSIAVDFRGNIGVGFSASAATLYAGSFYTGRLTNAAAGTMQPPGTNALGVDYYIRKFGGARNRWGDYSGIALDPATESTFWVFNEYAMTRGTAFSGEDGRWATRWGSFTFNNRPAFSDLNLGTRKNQSVTFAASRLASDADGDTLSFSAGATTAQGGTVGIAGGNLTYTPPAGFSGADSFTVTADDSRGGTTNRTVSVTVNTGSTVSLNIVSPPTIQGGNFVVRFAGIPGRTYTIEWSADGVVWTKKTNLMAPTSNLGFGVGVFEFTDPTGGDTVRLFRTVYPSY